MRPCTHSLICVNVHTIELCTSLEARKFEEAECRPRPIPVPVSTQYQYKPYHIVLYQCTGTYNRISPSIKTCIPMEEHDVTVDVKDENEKTVPIILKNHTKCGGQCTISSCGKNMYMHDCECRCFPGSSDCPSIPVVDQEQKGARKSGEILTQFF